MQRKVSTISRGRGRAQIQQHGRSLAATRFASAYINLHAIQDATGVIALEAEPVDPCRRPISPDIMTRAETGPLRWRPNRGT